MGHQMGWLAGGEAFRLKGHEGGVLVFWFASHQRAFVLAFETTNFAKVAEAMEKAIRDQGDGQSVVIKGVGPETELTALRERLRAWKWPAPELRFVPRGSRIAIDVSGHETRLRFLVENQTAVSSQPSNVRGPRKVLIVDDSATVRKMLRQILSERADFTVVAETGDPLTVEALLVEHRPDVMTLDIHMPGLNGHELLKKIFPRLFVPTLVLSSLAISEGPAVLEAMENGAIDYMQKPTLAGLEDFKRDFVERLAVAARSPKAAQRVATSERLGAVDFAPNQVIAIGASTGGTEAIKDVLTRFPAAIPPIVIVQHIPPYFSAAFADRLNQLCAFEVREAVDGDELRPGLALVAPGGRQMKVIRDKGSLRARVTDDPPRTGHKPSVDYLFSSLAELDGIRIVAAVMTGMGKDGAQGLLELRGRGHATLAQDEATSVVFGMPKAAIEIGAAETVSSLDRLAPDILGQLKSAPGARRPAV